MGASGGGYITQRDINWSSAQPHSPRVRVNAMAEVEETQGKFAGLFDGVNCADQRSIWVGDYDYRALCMVNIFVLKLSLQSWTETACHVHP